MQRLLTSCLAYGLSGFLAMPVFADSPLESSISGSGWLATALEQISTERMLADIRTLSGREFGGRLTGSGSDEASAAFVAARFSELRLQRTPAPPPAIQTNPLPQR